MGSATYGVSANAQGWLLFAVALILRLWGIWYGLPSLYIGDESFHLLNALAIGARRSLEPLYVVYPTFFSYVLFLVYAATFAVGWLTGVFTSPLDFALRYFVDPTPLLMVGRAFSAVCGTAAVFLVYRLGLRNFGRQAAWLSAILLALSFGHVYSSHWILLEAPVALMAALSLVAIFRFHKSGRIRDLMLAGGIVGLAVSTKYNAGFLVISLLLATWWQSRDRGRAPWLAAATAGGAVAAGFLLGSPYWMITPGRFLAQLLDTSARMGEGMLGHAARVPLIWPLWELLRSDWGVGALLLFGIVSGVLVSRSRKRLLLLAYIVPTLLVIGSWQRTGVGYLMPIYPALVLLAADRLVDTARRISRWLVPAVVLALGVSFLQVVIYDARLAGEDTRAVAERWITHNLAPRSVIGYENFPYGPNLFDPDRFLRNNEEGSLLPPQLVEKLRREATRRPSYHLVHLRKDFGSQGGGDAAQRSRYPTAEALKARAVRFLMLSSENYGRYFEPAPAEGSPLWREYQAGRTFYEMVFRSREFSLLAEFRPSFWQPGPVIRIYELAAP